MLLCGVSFPLCGVAVLRLGLIPLRYMLMHGVLLGGAIAMALSLPPEPVALAVNLLLVFAILDLSPGRHAGFGAGSAAAMVVSMALASLVMHLAAVPAKDTLGLLWGSPFALTPADLVVLAALALAILLGAVFRFRPILALFFNADIAQASGVRVRLLQTFIVLAIAIVVAAGMKLLGAFLVDAALLLPVLCAAALQRGNGSAPKGMRFLCGCSCLCGVGICVGGYVAAVLLNLPPAATIGSMGGVLYGFLSWNSRRHYAERKAK